MLPSPIVPAAPRPRSSGIPPQNQEQTSHFALLIFLIPAPLQTHCLSRAGWRQGCQDPQLM